MSLLSAPPVPPSPQTGQLLGILTDLESENDAATSTYSFPYSRMDQHLEKGGAPCQE